MVMSLLHIQIPFPARKNHINTQRVRVRRRAEGGVYLRGSVEPDGGAVQAGPEAAQLQRAEGVSERVGPAARGARAAADAAGHSAQRTVLCEYQL